MAAETVDDRQVHCGYGTVSNDDSRVEFGLKFSASGNVIVAGASTEATLVIKLTMQKQISEHAGLPARDV
jgi:hypothetical protein